MWLSFPSPPEFIAGFDSTSAMLRATASRLHGQEFSGLGIAPKFLEPAVGMINRLPRSVREAVYTWSGWGEAVSPLLLGTARSERVAEWMVSLYPERRYPAVAIGSSNGALVHLYAALGIPWLPQTFLIPVARGGVHPDEPKQDLEWGIEPGRRLLDANPDLQLHHMNDANQDRLMIRRMTYFRVKWLRLTAAYERFLTRWLPPGGTIFLAECNLKWPTVRLGPRHYFQHGALGGATVEEFRWGSPRVANYLARYGSHRRAWDSPEPTGESPEAEWGFEPKLRHDVERIARQRGYRVRRIVFDDPESVSPLVADLYRWWYAQRRISARRLLVESFILMEPLWTLRTASAPFWMTFNKEPSAETLEKYVDLAGPLDEIYLMLFSHGVDSVGLVPIERWRAVLALARKRGEFIGVDEKAYPRDFATFLRYSTDIKKIPARYPIPGWLTMEQLDAFLAESQDQYVVEWLEEARQGPVS